VQNPVSAISDSPEGSCYQIAKQKGDYNDSEREIASQEPVLALGAGRDNVFELWFYLSSCDD